MVVGSETKPSNGIVLIGAGFHIEVPNDNFKENLIKAKKLIDIELEYLND